MIRMVFLNEDKRISMILEGKLTPAQVIRAFISSAEFMTKLPGNEGYIKIPGPLGTVLQVHCADHKRTVPADPSISIALKK